MRIEHLLRNSSRQFGDKTALIAGGRRSTYSEVDRASNALAGFLRAQGIARGDRVIVFMDNSWAAVVGIFGVLKAGAVLSPLNPTTKADKLAFILNNCRATAILTETHLQPIVAEARSKGPSVLLTLVAGDAAPSDGTIVASFETAFASALAPPSDVGISPDLALLIYTSGSTGVPKGVMMTHDNVMAAALSITTYLENTAEDVILNVLPISFDYGLYQILMAVKCGATLVLEKSFAFPQVILDRLRAEKVTGFPIVPTMAALILQMKDLRPGSIPSLRYITNTAATLPPAHIMRLLELFPDVRVFSMYGLTECKRCTYLPPAQLRSRPGSVGIAIPNTEAMVVDENGRPVPHGLVGELVIRGPHVMKGYWENPEATNRVLRPGLHPWERVLYTGDLFRADEDGFLYFVGRKDDIIKTRGEKVSPKEVETVLYELAGVQEVAVIGVPDPVLGSAIKAVVVIAPGAALTERDVMRHCAGYLEDFMVPKLVEFRDRLPKTDTGKISRRLVADPLGSVS